MQYITFMTSIYKTIHVNKNRFNHNNKVKTVLSLNIISNHNFSTFIKDLYPIFYKSIYFSIQILTSARHKLQLHC